jgi:hypothetical protein
MLSTIGQDQQSVRPPIRCLVIKLLVIKDLDIQARKFQAAAARLGGMVYR